jgi:hypothetical protein
MVRDDDEWGVLVHVNIVLFLLHSPVMTDPCYLSNLNSLKKAFLSVSTAVQSNPWCRLLGNWQGMAPCNSYRGEALAQASDVCRLSMVNKSHGPVSYRAPVSSESARVETPSYNVQKARGLLARYEARFFTRHEHGTV